MGDVPQPQRHPYTTRRLARGAGGDAPRSGTPNPFSVLSPFFVCLLNSHSSGVGFVIPNHCCCCSSFCASLSGISDSIDRHLALFFSPLLIGFHFRRLSRQANLGDGFRDVLPAKLCRGKFHNLHTRLNAKRAVQPGRQTEWSTSGDFWQPASHTQLW